MTLVGPGGVGKTRLANELAAELETEFDRIVTIDLAAGAAALDRLDASSLRAAATLVMLDNCEHVVDEIARPVAEILVSSKLTTIVATSRRRLDIAEERLFSVRPLSTPVSEGTVSDLVSCESTQLFLERSAQLDPSFEVTVENADVVARICRLSEGLPIVIELAAGLTRSRSLDGIVTAMSRFGTHDLEVRRRDVHEHQQSLTRSIDWSLQLLAQNELLLLQCAAAFHGTFAAESLAELHELVGGATTESLTDRLVEHSLLSFDGRFRMLEVVASAVRAATEPQVAATLDAAHTDWARRRCAVIAARSTRPDPDLTFADFGHDLDDLAAAADRLAEFEEVHAWVNFVGPIAEWWVHRGGPVDAERWQQFLHAAEPSAAAVGLAAGLAFHSGHTGEDAAALDASQRAVDMANSLERAELSVTAFVAMGNAHQRLGDHANAAAAFARAEQALPEPSNAYLESMVLLCKSRGEPDVSRRQALLSGIVERVGSSSPAMRVAAELELAGIELDAGNLDRAAELVAAAERVAARIGFHEALATGCNRTGDIARVRRQVGEATRAHQRAVELGQRIGHVGVIADGIAGLSRTHLQAGDPTTAGRLAFHARSLLPQVGLSEELTGLADASSDAAVVPLRDLLVLVPTATSDPASPTLLTPRETDVLRLLRGDLTQREIADELYVSPSTVRAHVKSIYRKLGVHNRTGCVHHATVLGLLSPPSAAHR